MRGAYGNARSHLQVKPKHSPGSRLSVALPFQRGVIRGRNSALEAETLLKTTFFALLGSGTHWNTTVPCWQRGDGKQIPNKLFLGAPVTLPRALPSQCNQHSPPCSIPGFSRLFQGHQVSSSTLVLTQGSCGASSVKPRQLITPARSFQEDAAGLGGQIPGNLKDGSWQHLSLGWWAQLLPITFLCRKTSSCGTRASKA